MLLSFWSEEKNSTFMDFFRSLMHNIHINTDTQASDSFTEE